MAASAVAYNKDAVVTENGAAINDEVINMKAQHVRDMEIANTRDQVASNTDFTNFEDQAASSMDVTAMDDQTDSHMDMHSTQNHVVAELEITTMKEQDTSMLGIDTRDNQFLSHMENLNAENHSISNLEMVSAEVHDMVPTVSSGPIRRRRKKSMVWEHFTLESEADGSSRARCQRCNQTFAYSTGSKLSGTSHLKRHIALGTCLKNMDRPRVKRRRTSHGISQSTILPITDGGTPITPPAKDGGTLPSPAVTDGGTLPIPTVTDGGAVDAIKRRRRRKFDNLNITFDQDRSTQDLVKMIILHDYPLHMVEHSGFMNFVQNLQPRFRIADFSTVENECLAAYQKEKHNVFQIMETIPGRICLSIDLYMSTQTLGYLCLIGHFIGPDWKPHKRVINLTVVSFPHTGNAHAEAIAGCLAEWNIENRLFTITLDGSPSNDNVSAYLRDQHSNSNILGLNGQIFIVRCFAHVVNTIAQDGLESLHEIVYKVRESVKYVKACHKHEETFAKVVQELQITTSKALSLDVQNQWNTTYLMLETAAQYKGAFSHLETCDSNYNDVPSADEWSKVETLCRYLRFLYDGANFFTGVAYPTANMYFHEAWKIQLELSSTASSEDPLVASIAKPMHEKFNKFWADCSLVLAMAVLVDPRYKMKLVEFSYSKIYGDHAEQYVKAVDDCIHDLYLEYVAQPLPLTPAYEEQNSLDIDVKECGTLLISDDGLLDFDVYISELSNSQQTRSELDQYLEESLLPRIHDFDVLSWWKANKFKFPTLSNMARDILAIPFTTVNPESIFSTRERVLDDYRSNLKAETVEALVCARDWFRCQQQPKTVEASTALVKMEL